MTAKTRSSETAPPAAARRRATRLRKEIERHRRLYYVENSPEIADTDFDALERELRELENRYPTLMASDSPTATVGGEPAAGLAAVRHRLPMLSLENTYSEDEAREWQARLYRALEISGEESLAYVTELKIDGLSISLIYEQGELRQGLTRGDGRVGEVVTSNIRTVRSIPQRIEGAPERLEVRGEIFFPLSEFRRLNEQRQEAGLAPFANPRNAAAGSIRLIDPRQTANRRLDGFIYQVVEARGADFERHSSILEKMRNWGFPVNPHGGRCASLEEALEFCRNWQQRRNELDYEIDGVVLKLDDLDLQEEAGATAKSPRWAMAYKFPSEQVETRVRDIRVQVGRTGALTPVAELQPVELGGTTIARATLHNEEEVRRKDVRVGDAVIVEKGGEVIPKVVRVLEKERPRGTAPFRMPEQCPVCGSDIFRAQGEVVSRCTGASCPAKLRESVLHFASRRALDIEGLGEALVDQLMEKKRVIDLADLYGLDRDGLASLDRMGQKSAENLLRQIDKSRRLPLHRLLFGLGIRFVGERTAQQIGRRFGTLDRLQEATQEELEEVEDVGPRVAASVHAFFAQSSNQKLIDRLRSARLNFTEPQAGVPPASGPFAGKTFVLTGILDGFTRDEAVELIRTRGGRVSGSVSRKTDYVLAGATPGSKAKKAREMGVALVSERDFRKMLGES